MTYNKSTARTTGVQPKQRASNRAVRVQVQSVGREAWVRVAVRLRMESFGWSIRDAAAQAGVSHTAVHRYLQGGSVRSGTLLALMEAVGLEIVEGSGL